MKTISLLAYSCLVFGGYAQCPFTVALKSTGNCLGSTLAVTTDHILSEIVWYKDGAPVKTVLATVAGEGITVAGGNGQGSGSNQLKGNWKIFVDQDDNVYVADAGNNRIQKWTPGATAGVTVAGGNGAGSADNQMTPAGVYVDDMGNIYVADDVNYRIQKWAPGATSGVTVATGPLHAAPTTPDAFQPESIYVDGAGNMYFPDFSPNSRVLKWTPGAASGVTVAGGNGIGAAPNQLNYPTDVYVDGSGNIYVADGGNYRVQKWAPGAASGVTVAGGNGAGAAPNQLNGVAGIFVDVAGNVYVADNANYRIQKWAPGATTGVTVAGGNGPGSAPGQFNGLTGIFVNADGDLFVSDLYNARVQKWGLTSSIETLYKPDEAGTYTATVTDNNGCTATAGPVIINPSFTPALTITSSAPAVCSGSPVSFTAHAVDGGSAPLFQWQVNGLDVAGDDNTYTRNDPADGDMVTCLLTNNAVCAMPATTGSNSIRIIVDASVASPVSISASDPVICSGQPASFTASTPNGVPLVYHWLVNGAGAGEGSVFSDSHLSDGDVITCTTSSLNGCATSISNSIPVTVYPSPVIEPMSPVLLPRGTSVVLQPVIEGDIDSYSWTPATGLSDSHIAGPAATPPQSMVYNLHVSTAAGCKASAEIKISVFSKLLVPNAFTPNGDGRNDVFYVISGPAGSGIRDFSIFNRWGQKVFGHTGGFPGDPSTGWNGSYKGAAAPTGAYAYIITVLLEDGTSQVLQGTVLLIR